MAVTPNNIITPQTPKITPQNFVQGTDSALTLKTLYTGGTNGSKVVAVLAATDDGSATHVLTLYITRSAVDYYVGAYTIPVSSGTSGAIANVNLLNGGPLSLIVGLPTDNDGQKYIFLESGDTLRGTFATALTAAKRIDILTIGANF
jgi:hypothetical protein